MTSPQGRKRKAVVRDAHRVDRDGHVWAKYGHKILASETGIRRQYYACVLRDQCGCQARKTVDRAMGRSKGQAYLDRVLLEGAHNHPPPGSPLSSDDDEAGEGIFPMSSSERLLGANPHSPDLSGDSPVLRPAQCGNSPVLGFAQCGGSPELRHAHSTGVGMSSPASRISPTSHSSGRLLGTTRPAPALATQVPDNAALIVPEEFHAGPVTPSSEEAGSTLLGSQPGCQQRGTQCHALRFNHESLMNSTRDHCEAAEQCQSMETQEQEGLRSGCAFAQYLEPGLVSEGSCGWQRQARPAAAADASGVPDLTSQEYASEVVGTCVTTSSTALVRTGPASSHEDMRILVGRLSREDKLQFLDALAQEVLKRESLRQKGGLQVLVGGVLDLAQRTLQKSIEEHVSEGNL